MYSFEQRESDLRRWANELDLKFSNDFLERMTLLHSGFEYEMDALRKEFNQEEANLHERFNQLRGTVIEEFNQWAEVFWHDPQQSGRLSPEEKSAELARIHNQELAKLEESFNRQRAALEEAFNQRKAAAERELARQETLIKEELHGLRDELNNAFDQHMAALRAEYGR
jgi:uncharacterized membrane-anchored protein YhcB (DUF1043 family)